MWNILRLIKLVDILSLFTIFSNFWNSFSLSFNSWSLDQILITSISITSITVCHRKRKQIHGDRQGAWYTWYHASDPSTSIHHRKFQVPGHVVHLYFLSTHGNCSPLLSVTPSWTCWSGPAAWQCPWTSPPPLPLSYMKSYKCLKIWMLLNITKI